MSGPMKPEVPTATFISETIAFGMFVAAARADSTKDQYERLRATVLPLMDDYRATGDMAPVKAAVQEVMGPDWAPGGEYKTAIDTVMSVAAATQEASEESTEGSRK